MVCPRRCGGVSDELVCERAVLQGLALHALVGNVLPRLRAGSTARCLDPCCLTAGRKEPPQGVKLLPSAMTAFAVNVSCADAQAEPG